VWTAGALLAVAYSIGFWVLIMQCLKIGPAGPTVTVNNMAMVCGVLYGVLWLHPHGWPHALVVAGCDRNVCRFGVDRARRGDVRPTARSPAGGCRWS
jgi:hypothetical protein